MSNKVNSEKSNGGKSHPVYNKQQFLDSKLFTAQQKDMLNAVLQDGKHYTLDQVDQHINEFLKKAVH